jgi:hypothetical protein
VIWVGTDDGKVHVTQDGGKNWTEVTAKIAGMPKGSWVPQIQASTYNAGEAFVVVNNYRLFDYKPYLFRTKDYGATWESLVTPAQVGDNNYSLAVVQDPVEPKLIFLGMENGLFVSVDEGKNWTKWTAEFPAGVPVMDLVIHPREYDLVMGTFGRAIYVLDDIRPLRELAKSGSGILNNTLKIFSPPDAYLASRQQPAGARFDADATFNGRNRPFGALISYVVNKPADKKEEPKSTDKADAKGSKKSSDEKKPESTAKKPPAVKYDSVKLEVFNASGELINTIRQKAPEENGIARMSWMLNEKSERNPSREKPREDGGGRGGFGGFGGLSVLPGTYKLRLSFGDRKDSTSVTIKTDPRIQTPPSVLEERYTMIKDLQKLTAVTTKATDRLRESLEIVDEFEKKIKEAKRSDLKEAGDKTKVMKDSINALFDFILGKVDKRQGIIRSPDPTPVSYIQTAQGYIGRSQDSVSETDRRVFKHADDKIAEVVNRVNAFYANEWPKYKTAMEAVNIAVFKEYEPLKK